MSKSPLIIAFADRGYLPLLQIWLAHMKRLELDRIRVYCLDQQTREWCESQEVAAIQVPWAGGLLNLWQQRARVFCELLAGGDDFIHSDIDAFWIKNPFQCGSAAERTEDLLFSSGTVWPLDIHARWGFVLCCGWFWAKTSPATRAFFEAVERDIPTAGVDQTSVNRLLAQMGAKWNHSGSGDYQMRNGDHVVQCWTQPIRATTAAGALSVALLPHREFQRLPDNPSHAIVKHYLTPKDCQQKLAVLRKYGLA
jgi:Nucleotide-diphospho-sugar transferase